MSKAVKSLSDREKETLRLLVAGHDAKSIARTLDLSVHTVNDRLREARRKLGTSSSREAARMLAQAEGSGPKNLVPMHFGIAAEVKAREWTQRASQLAGVTHRHWWLMGGSFVLVAIAAYAIGSLNGPESPKPDLVLAGQAAAPSLPPATAASASQAQSWLTLVDRQNWTASWQSAGRLFRSQVSPDGWVSAIVPVRSPLGAVKSRSLVKATRTSSLPGAPSGDYELLEFQTNFVAKSGAIETVIMAKEPTGWRVIGYFIR